ncbi:DUF4139 domain-containing protein [Kitasatospora sp. LaBMicrA B282]|uniref:DUF4139 domain-containing protein n=1 Tax=Kitasatospora sp. LaBMicrA B282 TaxID=3420949 RepID=UPI003D100D4C
MPETTPETMPRTTAGADRPNPALPLPVTAATCLEDRAHVERSATLTLSAGRQRLRLGPISPLAVEHSLRAELTPELPAELRAELTPELTPELPAEPAGELTGEPGGPALRVLAVRLTRSWTPRSVDPPGSTDSPLRHRLHELETALRAGAQQEQRLAARLALLDRLAADLLIEVAEGTGRGEAEPDRWARELDRVAAEQDDCAERLRALRAEQAELTAQQQAAEEALFEAEQAPAELTAHLELTVEAERAGPARLTVRHLTPCALWRPAYRAVLADGALRLESDAVVWQVTGEDWRGARLSFSTARSALAGSPPLLHADRLTLRELSGEERRTVAVELREEEIGALGPDATAGPVADGLPGVDDGGEVRLLTAPAPADLPADGRAHRIPLGGFTAPGSAERIAAPELSPLAAEVVTFHNPTGHPLLAGPVELIRDSGFVGRGELPFTAAGAAAELSFPGTDDLRLVRTVEESRGTSGLPGLGQRTVLTRTVRVRVSRLSPPGAQGEVALLLRERIPVSEVSAVEVRLRGESCDPAPEQLDAEGVASWRLALPPGGRRTVTLVYEVTASAKVAGLTA